MTQQQMSPPRPLPACPDGHRARYMFDGRRAASRGGHFIECRCSRTGRHATFDLAWAHWHKQHGIPSVLAPSRPAAAAAMQLDLLGGVAL